LAIADCGLSIADCAIGDLIGDLPIAACHCPLRDWRFDWRLPIARLAI
jgi:hypothetical protein